MGYRQWVTYLKIDKIAHNITEASFQEAADITQEVEILNLKPTVALSIGV